MRIEVSQLPPLVFSPNWRGHWAERYEAARLYQEAVFYECVDARNRLERVPWRPGGKIVVLKGLRPSGFPPFEKPRLDLTFVFPNHRIRDEDNLRARFKPGLDAIVQAGLIEGDSIELLELGKITVEVDRDRAPLTIIELGEANVSNV